MLGQICKKLKTNTTLYPTNDFKSASLIDLITPHPEFGFEVLKNGDNWCVYAILVKRAIDAGHGCKVYLSTTNIKTLAIIPLNILKKYAIDLA